MIEANNALLDFQAADKTPWYDKISNEDFRLPAIEPLIVESNAPGFSPEDQVENNISCVDVVDTNENGDFHEAVLTESSSPLETAK